MAGFYLGALFNPDRNARITAMNQEPTGLAGQAASFAASEAARVQKEKQAIADAQAAALKAQQDAEAEAARQQKLLESQRQDAANLAQQRLQQSNFEQQQKISQAQFENQLQLMNKQEQMRQAEQALRMGNGGRGNQSQSGGWDYFGQQQQVFAEQDRQRAVNSENSRQMRALQALQQISANSQNPNMGFSQILAGEAMRNTGLRGQPGNFSQDWAGFYNSQLPFLANEGLMFNAL